MKAKCSICNKDIVHIRNHIKFEHLDIDYEEYFWRYILKEKIHPKCLYCSKNVKFYGNKFASYCSITCARKSKFDLTFLINKYGEILGKQKYEENIRKSDNSSLRKMIEKYGEEEGRKKYEEKRILNSFKQTLIGRIVKYGEVEGNKHHNKIKKQNSFNQSLKGLINKYGEVEGKKKYEERCKRLKYVNSIEHYILKYGEVEGKKKYEEKNSKCGWGLDTCILKYGEVEGKKKYEEYKINILKKIFKTKQKDIYFSRISQELFLTLIEVIDKTKKYYFGKEEYFLNNGKHFFIYDFTDLENKKIIEFNGDYWHANPNMYLSESIIKYPGNKSLFAKDIWEYDKQKILLAKERGFDILIIWESEYKKDKKEILYKCKKFLMK